MRDRNLIDKITEVLTSSLDIHCIDGPDGMVEATHKLLLDKKYRGSIIIVYGNEGYYRFQNTDKKEDVYMLFIDETQLKNFLRVG